MDRFGAIVLIALLGLCGCVSQQQMAARQAAQKASTNQADDTQCRSYGVAPGSDGYVACRMNLNNNRATAEQINAINQQRNSAAMMSTGAAILNGH